MTGVLRLHPPKGERRSRGNVSRRKAEMNEMTDSVGGIVGINELFMEVDDG